MAFGFNTNGFIRKTFQDIKSSLETRWRQSFGNNQDLSEDSPNSILIGLETAGIEELWSFADVVVKSLNRHTAEGVFLDYTNNLIGSRRVQSSPTLVNVSFYGDNATLIPQATQVKQSITNLIFETVEQSFITQNKTNLIRLQVSTISNNSLYTLYINGISYNYTSSGSATEDEIVLGLKSLVDAALLGLDFTNEGSGVMLIESTNKKIVYDITSNQRITVLKAQSIISTKCITNGANIVNIGSIVELSTAINGIDSVYNYEEGITGKNIETDQEYRLRGQTDIYVAGFNFVGALKAKIRNNVLGVTYCNVVENDELQTDINGIPAKSFEAIVEGGDSYLIAEQVFKTKAAGIKPHGNVSVFYYDEDDIPHLVRFSRPENLYFWLKVTVLEYNSEEILPSQAALAIIQAILNYSKDEFNIGSNIILQKFYTPVYQIDGIANVTIEMFASDNPNATPVYDNQNINCNIREKPSFDESRIEVILT